MLISRRSCRSTAAASSIMVDPHLRTPYVYQYNLSLQHNLFADTVLETNYVGSSAHGLTSLKDINPMVLGTTNRALDSSCSGLLRPASRIPERVERQLQRFRSQPHPPAQEFQAGHRPITLSPTPTLTIWITPPGFRAAQRLRCPLTAPIFSTLRQTAMSATASASVAAGICPSIASGAGSEAPDQGLEPLSHRDLAHRISFRHSAQACATQLIRPTPEPPALAILSLQRRRRRPDPNLQPAEVDHDQSRIIYGSDGQRRTCQISTNYASHRPLLSSIPTVFPIFPWRTTPTTKAATRAFPQLDPVNNPADRTYGLRPQQLRGPRPHQLRHRPRQNHRYHRAVSLEFRAGILQRPESSRVRATHVLDGATNINGSTFGQITTTGSFRGATPRIGQLAARLTF